MPGLVARSSFRYVGASAACAAALAGCTLLVSLDGLSTSSAPDAPATDASEAQAAGGDARVEAAIEGGAEAGTGPFCATRSPAPTFCIDFDTSAGTDDRATFHAVNGYMSGGISEIDKAAFVSAPASLHLGVPGGVPGIGSGITNRVAYQLMASATTSAHVECDVRLDAEDAVTRAYIVWLDIGSDRSVLLYSSSAGSGIMETYVVAGSLMLTTHPFPSPLPFQTWTHVAIDIAFSGAGATVSANLGGGVALDKVALAPPFAGGGTAQLSLGPAYYTTSSVGPAEQHFDNVLVDLH